MNFDDQILNCNLILCFVRTPVFQLQPWLFSVVYRSHHIPVSIIFSIFFHLENNLLECQNLTCFKGVNEIKDVAVIQHLQEKQRF